MDAILTQTDLRLREFKRVAMSAFNTFSGVIVGVLPIEDRPCEYIKFSFDDNGNMSEWHNYVRHKAMQLWQRAGEIGSVGRITVKEPALGFRTVMNRRDWRGIHVNLVCEYDSAQLVCKMELGKV